MPRKKKEPPAKPCSMTPEMHAHRPIPKHIQELPPASIPCTILVQIPAKDTRTCNFLLAYEGANPTADYVLRRSYGYSEGFIGDFRLPLSTTGQYNLTLLHTQKIPQLHVTPDSYFYEENEDNHWRVMQPCVEQILLYHKPGTRRHLVIPSCYYLDYNRLRHLHMLLQQADKLLTFSVAANPAINSLLHKHWQYEANNAMSKFPFRTGNFHWR